MSTADGWDLTVPEDEAELLAELRRHGVRPGQRLHVMQTPEQTQTEESDDESPPEGPRRHLRFAGIIKDAEPDLSTNTEQYLKDFGRA